jgi:RimJ/RimL family protein N-acetyltransferase
MSQHDVTLRQVDRDVARDVVDGVRPSIGWAEDFPAEGDRAGMSYAGFEANELWSSPYLILVDNVVSGSIGFKGAPVDNRVEVGYGVVASQRGHGVASSALLQLLALIEGRSLDVRAETATWNTASQAVLRHAGFREVGEQHDPRSGDVVIWERHVD